MKIKHCTTCKKDKPINLFSLNPTKKDGLCSKCKECQNVYAKEHYKKNKDKYIAHIKKYRQIKKEFIDSQKIACVKCGESDICCLDYHHLDEKKKDFSVSRYRYHSLNKLKIEIQKCIVLCSNCHRKLHSTQNGGDAPPH